MPRPERLTISIDMRSAAFEDNPNEAAVMLRRIATDLDPLPNLDDGSYQIRNIVDTNGNTVGSYMIDTLDSNDEEDES